MQQRQSNCLVHWSTYLAWPHSTWTIVSSVPKARATSRPFWRSWPTCVLCRFVLAKSLRLEHIFWQGTIIFTVVSVLLLYELLIIFSYRAVAKLPSFVNLELNGNTICEAGVDAIRSVLQNAGKVLGGMLPNRRYILFYLVTFFISWGRSGRQWWGWGWWSWRGSGWVRGPGRSCRRWWWGGAAGSCFPATSVVW